MKYICEDHNKKYIEYCNKCKQNICKLCKNVHKNHNIIFFCRNDQNKNKCKKEKNEIKKT